MAGYPHWLEGSKSPNSRLSEQDVELVWALRPVRPASARDGAGRFSPRGIVSAAELAEQLEVHPNVIYGIWNRQRWRWLTRTLEGDTNGRERRAG